jgi:predicted ATPase
MLTHITAKNFKSLKDVSLKTSALNLLTGVNGIGKTSLLQILLLLKQSVENSLELNGEWVTIGRGKDLLYQFAEEDNVTLDIRTTDHKTLAFHLPINRNSLFLVNRLAFLPKLTPLLRTTE